MICIISFSLLIQVIDLKGNQDSDYHKNYFTKGIPKVF